MRHQSTKRQNQLPPDVPHPPAGAAERHVDAAAAAVGPPTRNGGSPIGFAAVLSQLRSGAPDRVDLDTAGVSSDGVRRVVNALLPPAAHRVKRDASLPLQEAAADAKQLMQFIQGKQLAALYEAISTVERLLSLPDATRQERIQMAMGGCDAIAKPTWEADAMAMMRTATTETQVKALFAYIRSSFETQKQAELAGALPNTPLHAAQLEGQRLIAKTGATLEYLLYALSFYSNTKAVADRVKEEVVEDFTREQRLGTLCDTEETMRVMLVEKLRDATLAEAAESTRRIESIEGPRAAESVSSLTLSGNSFGDGGACHLAELLRFNSKIKRLSISRCSICDAGAASLAEALQVPNTSLTSLDLSHNAITEAGAASLLSIFRYNTTLQSIRVEGNLMSPEMESLIDACAERNRTSYAISGLTGEKGVVARPGAAATVAAAVATADTVPNDISRAVTSCVRDVLSYKNLASEPEACGQSGQFISNEIQPGLCDAADNTGVKKTKKAAGTAASPRSACSPKEVRQQPKRRAAPTAFDLEDFLASLRSLMMLGKHDRALDRVVDLLHDPLVCPTGNERLQPRPREGGGDGAAQPEPTTPTTPDRQPRSAKDILDDYHSLGAGEGPNLPHTAGSGKPGRSDLVYAPFFPSPDTDFHHFANYEKRMAFVRLKSGEGLSHKNKFKIYQEAEKKWKCMDWSARNDVLKKEMAYWSRKKRRQRRWQREWWEQPPPGGLKSRDNIPVESDCTASTDSELGVYSDRKKTRKEKKKVPPNDDLFGVKREKREEELMKKKETADKEREERLQKLLNGEGGSQVQDSGVEAKAEAEAKAKAEVEEQEEEDEDDGGFQDGEFFEPFFEEPVSDHHFFINGYGRRHLSGCQNGSTARSQRHIIYHEAEQQWKTGDLQDRNSIALQEKSRHYEALAKQLVLQQKQLKAQQKQLAEKRDELKAQQQNGRSPSSAPFFQHHSVVPGVPKGGMAPGAARVQRQQRNKIEGPAAVPPAMGKNTRFCDGTPSEASLYPTPGESALSPGALQSALRSKSGGDGCGSGGSSAAPRISLPHEGFDGAEISIMPGSVRWAAPFPGSNGTSTYCFCPSKPEAASEGSDATPPAAPTFQVLVDGVPALQGVGGADTPVRVFSHDASKNRITSERITHTGEGEPPGEAVVVRAPPTGGRVLQIAGMEIGLPKDKSLGDVVIARIRGLLDPATGAAAEFQGEDAENGEGGGGGGVGGLDSASCVSGSQGAVRPENTPDHYFECIIRDDRVRFWALPHSNMMRYSINGRKRPPSASVDFDGVDTLTFDGSRDAKMVIPVEILDKVIPAVCALAYKSRVDHNLPHSFDTPEYVAALAKARAAVRDSQKRDAAIDALLEKADHNVPIKTLMARETQDRVRDGRGYLERKNSLASTAGEAGAAECGGGGGSEQQRQQPVPGEAEIPVAAIPWKFHTKFGFLSDALFYGFFEVLSMQADYTSLETRCLVVGDTAVYLYHPNGNVDYCISVADVKHILVGIDGDRSLHLAIVSGGRSYDIMITGLEQDLRALIKLLKAVRLQLTPPKRLKVARLEVSSDSALREQVVIKPRHSVNIDFIHPTARQAPVM